MSVPLEPDPSQRSALTDDVGRFLDRFYASLDDLPTRGPELGSDDLEKLRMPPPEDGRDIAEILDVVGVANRPGSLHPSPGHMAYIPNGGLFTAALAEFLAQGLNRYTGVTLGAPGFAELESSVVRWMCDLFELPDTESGGILLSGGSMANLTAVVTARTSRLPAEFLSGTIYVSPHVHHSVTKAARLAGFPAERVRTVPVDAELRLDVDHLAEAVGADRRRGLTPFMVVGSAGTTDSGAVDPLADIAAFASEQGLWFHIDAAYGGFFQLTERGRKRLVGISAADSITLDPHKGLSIPFGVGALLVRERRTLLEANAGKGAYLQDHADTDHDFSSLGPELTRPFRGLSVWLPLHLHGIAPFRATLEGALDMAQHAYERLRELEWVEHVWRPDLSIVAFRARDDDRGRRAQEHANATGRVYLSSTSVDGRFVLRLAILNRRTTLDHVDLAIDLLSEGFGS